MKKDSQLIAVDWGSVEETFVVWRFEGNNSLREFQLAYIIMKKMVSSKNYPIDVIIDLRMAKLQTKLLPPALAFHERHCPQNIHRTILLHHNDFWQRNLRLMENFHPGLSHNLIFTTSVDEAYLLVLPAAS